MMQVVLMIAAPLLLLVLYGMLAGYWAALSHRMDPKLEDNAVRAGGRLAVFYVLWLIALGIWQARLPVITPGQLLVFLGGLAWIGHTYAQRKIRQRMLTILPLVSVIVLLLAGLLLGLAPAAGTPEALSNPRAAMHITLSMAAVAFLLGSGVFGAGEVILHRQLKRRAFGRWFHNLPSLSDMNRLRRLTLTAGWALITFSLLSALASLLLLPETREATISHLHPMLLLWVAITSLWLSDRFGWLAQQKLAVGSLAMSAVMIILIVVSVVEFFIGRVA